jgi:hypothetical protein
MPICPDFGRVDADDRGVSEQHAACLGIAAVPLTRVITNAVVRL